MATKKKTTTDPNKRRLLTDYIQEQYLNYGFERDMINWQMICKQIQNIQKENPKLNDDWIRYTLWYMIEIKQQNLFDDEFTGSILNLVPYAFTEAYKYWKNNKEVLKEFENFEPQPSKVVYIDNRVKRNNKDISFD